MRPYWIEKKWWGEPILAAPGDRIRQTGRAFAGPAIVAHHPPPETADDRRTDHDSDHIWPAGQ